MRLICFPVKFTIKCENLISLLVCAQCFDSGLVWIAEVITMDASYYSRIVREETRVVRFNNERRARAASVSSSVTRHQLEP